MVPRDSEHFLQGQQAKMGAQQPEPAQTGEVLQLCLHSDDAEPSEPCPSVDSRVHPHTLRRSR